MTGFQKFWEAYPRKTNKQAAKAAYERLEASAETEAAILEGVLRHRKQWHQERTPATYIPHASTWLNQGRWEWGVPTVGRGRRAEPMAKSRMVGEWLRYLPR